MQKIYLKRVNDTLVPCSVEDREAVMDLKPNQTVEVSFRYITEYRSLKQINAFHACCRTVASNIDDPNLSTPKLVKAYVKLKCGFYEDGKIQGATPCPKCGTMVKIYQWILKSLAFDKSKHIETTDFLSRAFPFMADLIGVTEEELLNNSQ